LKKILNLIKEPILNSFWYYADLTSIVPLSDKDNYFLANNYNNIFCNTTTDIPIIRFDCEVAYPMMNMYYDCPFLDFQKINKSYFFSIANLELIDFLKISINHGYYILVMVDRQYIKEYEIIEPSNHEIMIYGYNCDDETICFCDNDKNGLYRTDLKCSFSSFCEAYNNIIFQPTYYGNMLFSDHMYLIKPQNNLDYSLDIKEIKVALKQYLNVEPAYGAKACDVNEIIWGVKVYEVIKGYFNYISGCKENYYKKDIRQFCVLWDHKKSILATLGILNRENYINESFTYRYKDIEKNTLLLRNTILKLYISNNKSIIKNINKLLDTIIINEYALLESILHEI